MFGITPLYKDEKPGEAQTTLCRDLKAPAYLKWKAKVNLEDYIYKQKKLWKNTFTDEN